MSTQVDIEVSWKRVLQYTFDKPFFQDIIEQIRRDIQLGKQIFPAGKNIFRAFALTPFQAVKVVILGQDPYHHPGQAHGLAFSVPEGVDIPPSLLNIYKELQDDLSIPIHKSGDLSKWAEQGVLLLNTSLTVEAYSPASHSTIGWHRFTDAVIEILSHEKEHLVFILWGKHAQTKSALIDEKKHFIISSAHPSPLSAHRGFMGSKPFSKTNQYLQQNGIAAIDWKL